MGCRRRSRRSAGFSAAPWRFPWSSGVRTLACLFSSGSFRFCGFGGLFGWISNVSPKLKRGIPLLLAFAAVALIYGPWVWHGTFAHWDLNMVADPLRRIGSLREYFRAWGTPR